MYALSGYLFILWSRIEQSFLYIFYLINLKDREGKGRGGWVNDLRLKMVLPTLHIVLGRRRRFSSLWVNAYRLFLSYWKTGRVSLLSARYSYAISFKYSKKSAKVLPIWYVVPYASHVSSIMFYRESFIKRLKSVILKTCCDCKNKFGNYFKGLNERWSLIVGIVEQKSALQMEDADNVYQSYKFFFYFFFLVLHKIIS